MLVGQHYLLIVQFLTVWGLNIARLCWLHLLSLAMQRGIVGVIYVLLLERLVGSLSCSLGKILDAEVLAQVRPDLQGAWLVVAAL